MASTCKYNMTIQIYEGEDDQIQSKLK